MLQGRALLGPGKETVRVHMCNWLCNILLSYGKEQRQKRRIWFICKVIYLHAVHSHLIWKTNDNGLFKE